MFFSDAEGNTQIETNSWVVPALGHKLVHVPAVEATKDKDGNIEYWVCSRCEKLFSDSEGIHEITKADTVVVFVDPGDINGDDSLDHGDLNALVQHLGGGDVEINEAAADLNGDGNVDEEDVVELVELLKDDLTADDAAMLLDNNFSYASALLLQHLTGLKA